ncbi:phosphonate metabolism transcriptional regulator PhnF [Halobacillus halophilus]|uniref:GntR family transcription regulator n=1 Tax=Halobacillus halophilus (strain ATCC 35676 / DSM 2266 / JCM 20832 / KCTC 3685 / LMG 17431 / NBRC 102448 / NCIMB 2269) TaxID=866895 RepID=I0JIX0_HALH3|nr:phosphonate metabolism transcriptional regulator PhnF [Halobacillus halophilus]ASF38257.1 phosphonate metabolism transcriptional regulator PhnF [Halobacillus halophilus]CCG44088.1 GntR family transcription regulator [Halobacillus halophilus DSM 2266]
MIDKKSPLPIYYQIEESIKQRISDGEYQPNDMIPSERILSENYDVSRMTVRQAITNLVNEGVIYREKGRGTFIAENKIEQSLKGLTSFTEDMKTRGMTASSKLLNFEKVMASGEISRKLEIEEDEEIYRLQRIRYADQKPMAIETNFLPVAMFPNLNKEDVRGSLYDYVEKNKRQKIKKASQIIEATIANEDQSSLLEIPLGSAVLHIERHSFLEDGTPFEVVKSSYRADRYKFSSDITRG